MSVLKDLKPELVFKYFEEISNIPRGSGNEKEVSDYLLNFGKNLNLESIQDEANNIIIKKPATKGYENSPVVIIQGHMDMVCEKNNGTVHDFNKDPLKLRIVDDYIYASDTTLGADNGIAVAYAMAVLADNTIEHPAIEVLMTTDEETGMSGAMAINKAHLDGTVLINLDNEEEGELLVSCAGGVRSKGSLEIEWQNISHDKIVSISISGLKGGHSGIDIIKERGNSIKILGRVLNDLYGKVEFNIVSLTGGSKNNAIPRESNAILSLNSKDLSKLQECIEEWINILNSEFKTIDSDLKLNSVEHSEVLDKEFNNETTLKAVKLLYLYPNGINTRSTEIEGLIESSTNVGILTTTVNSLEFDSAIRSSVPSLKEDIVQRTKTIVELLGGKFETNAGYPAWQYKSDSKMREICQEVYKNMYGKEAKIVAIHAGVECGLFNEKLGDLDMISFGPNLYDVHTPEEHMSISSVKNVYEYLLEVLKNI